MGKISVLLVGGLLIVLVFAFFLFALLFGFPRNAAKAHLLTEELNLIGSRATSKEVERWLKEREVEHTYLDANKNDLSLESVVNQSGIPVKDLGGITVSIVRDVKRGFLVKWDLQLVFFFDKKRQLLTVRTGMTSDGL